MYSFIRPQLIVKDLSLIKLICIKDFDYFKNRTASISNEVKNLVWLKDQKWHEMRTTLNPTFSSSKMELMFNTVSDCALQFVRQFQKSHGMVEVDSRDVYARFVNDSIASVAFGINVSNCGNEFLVTTRSLQKSSLGRSLKVMGYSILPRLMAMLNIRIYPEKCLDVFTDAIKETICRRDQNVSFRMDMVHVLLELRQGSGIKDDREIGEEFSVPDEVLVGRQRTVALSDEDMVAHALVFLTAGTETTSTLMCFMSHELAVNEDVQKRLRNEIDDTIRRCDGKITYEALVGMKYLDMVISESLRKWPPQDKLERICGKDYTIRSEDGDICVVLEKGINTVIPVYAIHRDPRYFPNPEKFDPERFSDENKSNIVPYSYMPFGLGPRCCIAARFALLEAKILFFHLLHKFELVPTDKTVSFPRLYGRTISQRSRDSISIGLRSRIVL
ncbi:hypothetical protein RI129_010410 [Pyrocoelia pectoralis]|uniref:Cytochrome P450 n=1 Tax=Pyrocoelia pectoralis TaxID=417401 RepID=A0AAN7V7X6_9COLE